MAASSRSQHVSKTMTVALRQGHRQEIDHKGSRRCCTVIPGRCGSACCVLALPSPCLADGLQLNFTSFHTPSLLCPVNCSSAHI